jgi:hypothetical protein
MSDVIQSEKSYEPSVELNDNLAIAVIINLLKLANVLRIISML